MPKRKQCERCGRVLYLDGEGKLRDKEEDSVMCPNFDYIWHKEKGVPLD